MENDVLVRDLQGRLSKALTAESELRKMLQQSELKGEARDAEIQHLDGTCMTLRQANQTLSTQLQSSQNHLTSLIRELEVLPVEIDHVIADLEADPTNAEMLGGALVWISMTIKRTVEMFQHPDPVGSGINETLKAKLSENKELQTLLEEKEQQIQELQRRESELGANYNDLLREYEDLRQYFSETEEDCESVQEGDEAALGTGQACDVMMTSPLPQTSAASELDNVVMDMDELQSQLGKSFSITASSHQDLVADAETSPKMDAVEAPNGPIQDRLEQLASGTRRLDALFNKGNAKIANQLQKAAMLESELRSSLKCLNRGMTINDGCGSVSVDSSSDALAKSQPVHLHLHVVDQEQGYEEKRGDCCQKWRQKLTILYRRLMDINLRLFDTSCTDNASIGHSSSVLHWLDLHCEMSTQQTERNAGECQDDLHLLVRPPAAVQMGRKEDGREFVIMNARKLTAVRDQLQQLRAATAFEQFVIAEQQNLIKQSDEEIYKLEYEQIAATDTIAHLSSHLKERNGILNGLQADLNASRMKVSALQQDVVIVQHDVKSLNEKANVLQQEHDNMKANLTSLNDQRIAICTQVTALEQQVSSRKTEISEVGEQNNKLQQECEHLQETEAKLQKDLLEKQSAVRALTQQREQSDKVLQQKKRELDEDVTQAKAQMQEIKELTQRQAVLENACKRLQLQRSSLIAVKQKKEHAVHELQQSFTELPPCVGDPEEHSLQAGNTSTHTSPQDYSSTPKDQSEPNCGTAAEEETGEMAVSDKDGTERPKAFKDKNEQAQTSDSAPTSKEFNFQFASSSGHLLIKCLEDELKKQQEKNKAQEKVIDHMNLELQHVQHCQRSTSPTSARPPSPGRSRSAAHNTCNITELQSTLKNALDEMDRLYEQVTAMRCTSPIQAPDLLPPGRFLPICHPGEPIPRSSSPNTCASCTLIESHCTSHRTTLPFLKTRGQMRSELAAAEKQVSNLEDKMKEIARVSSIKDRLILDLQKQLNDRQQQISKPNHYWRY